MVTALRIKQEKMQDDLNKVQNSVADIDMKVSTHDDKIKSVSDDIDKLKLEHGSVINDLK